MSRPVALVTGSSRGIGKAIVVKLARQGHSVVVNYVRSEAQAKAVAREIEGFGGVAIAAQASVAEDQGRRRLIDHTLDRFGRLDVLVNNAGITSPGRMDLLETTEENWDVVFATNLKGPFFLAQQAAKAMIASIGRGAISRATIVNISSISAYAASANRADYCMAKAGMQMMTWLLADRLADEGVLVYEICPGVIESDMTAPVKEKYDQLIADGLSPIRRWGKPEDVADAVAMVAEGALPFSTGERINVDGGFHIRRL